MSEAVELVKEEKPALPQQPDDLLRLAVERGASVDTIERLMVVRRELNAERAKAEYDEALSAFQEECPIINKTKSGARDAYRYAPLDSIVAQVKHLIRKHGFSYKANAPTIPKPNWVKATITVTHKAGHSETSEFEVPVDDKNPLMTGPQRFGASLTFAKRYVFCNAFGILTQDEDMDGATNRPKPKGPSTVAPDEPTKKELASQLWKVLKTVRGTEANWNAANQWLWREEILDAAVPEAAPNLSNARFKEVITKAKEILCPS
jgi:hypothetical protein